MTFDDLAPLIDPTKNGFTNESVAYLHDARTQKTQQSIADELGVTARTVRRWEAKDNKPSPYRAHQLQSVLNLKTPHTTPESLARNAGDFTFIDLFAGIGGIREAFEQVGGKCVFTSEWDLYAQRTYAANYGNEHPIAGDITQIDAESIPDHDVLLAGFPCQPFSIAGVSKKASLGRAHGFADVTQGTLFFDVARIIEAKQPKAFLLENVKNLLSHDKGRTFEVIKHTLTQELGYHIQYKVIDGAHFVPQHRERIIIVGFREAAPFSFDNCPLPAKGRYKLSDILHKTDGTEAVLPWDDGRFFDHQARVVIPKYTLTDNLWRYLQAYAAKHRAAGNGFGFGLVGPDDVSRTLSARYYKDGSEILISQGTGKNPRRLTPRECARLMGFADTYQIPVSDTRAYKQFGNCVVVGVMAHVAKLMLPLLVQQVRV
jgi:DNA (cytosine-5)-methyltransferase 1